MIASVLFNRVYAFLPNTSGALGLNRHIKKYFFYLLGVFYDSLKKYDDALEAYSKVMRYRFFFSDVQSRFENSYKQKTLKSSLVITGGVGDFLQCIPYLSRNPTNDYVVITHFTKAKQFFWAFGIKPSEVNIFSNLDEERVIKNRVFNNSRSYKCPRDLFFEKNPLVCNNKSFKARTVGVHMSGSNFTVNLELKKGLTPKALPNSFILSLLDCLQDLNLIVIFFGTKKEILDLRIKEHSKLRIFCDDDITKNLSYVSHCDAFIGSDSAFKTMSSMLKIPTILLYTKGKNNFRDRMFINPYVKENVVHPFRYKDFSESEIKKTIAFIKLTLPRLFN